MAWQRLSTTQQEKVFTSEEIAQLFDLTFIVSPGWRILVDVHTPAGDGWATMNTWLDHDGSFILRGRSANTLGKYLWEAVEVGCRVRVVQGEKLNG